MVLRTDQSPIRALRRVGTLTTTALKINGQNDYIAKQTADNFNLKHKAVDP